MRSFYEVKFDLMKFCRHRQGSYRAQMTYRTLRAVITDHKEKLKDEDEQFFRDLIEDFKDPDTEHLPNDGSQQQIQTAAKYKIAAIKWILEEVSTEFIKQRIRVWLREYHPEEFVGAELVDIAQDSSPNHDERVEAQKQITEALEYFDDQYGYETESRNSEVQDRVINSEEIMEEAEQALDGGDNE